MPLLKIILALCLVSAFAWGLLQFAYDIMDCVWRWLRRESDVEEYRPAAEVGVPVWIVGNFERLMAFALVLFLKPKDAFTLLGIWLGAKLAASWHRMPVSNSNKKENRNIRAGTLAALIAGIVSVLLGALIGLAVRWVLQSHLIP